MHVDVIDNYEEFEALRSNWDSVYSADPEAQFFLSWIWLSQLFLRRPESCHILAARAIEHDGEYVAFLPLRPTTRYSQSRGQYISEIYMGGNFWADYTGLICRPEHHLSSIPAFAIYLQQMRWSKLTFENIRASAQRTALLKDAFPKSDFRVSFRKRTSKADGINNLISPFVRLPDNYEEYLQTKLSVNTRQKVRRFQRKLDSSEGLRIVESTSETRDQDLDAIVGYWKTRWADRKGKKVATLARKYRRILEQGLDADIIYMPVLRDENRPVAAVASFIDKEKKCMLFFVAGRDQSWKTLPSGLMLHTHNIRWAIDNGMSTYDLLRGDEQYKYSLGAEDRRIACIRVERRTGVNVHSELDPEGRDFILEDMGRRMRKLDDRTRRSLCRQVIRTWPEDESVLRQCEKHLVEVGDTGTARLIRSQLRKIHVANSTEDRAESTSFQQK